MSTAAPEPILTRDERLHRLRNTWQFAASAQFLCLFHPAFGIDDFFTEDLEDALLSDYDPYLVDLAVKMLRVMTQNRFITADTWSEYLRREFLRRDPHLNPFPAQSDDARWLRGVSAVSKVVKIKEESDEGESDEERNEFKQELKEGFGHDDSDEETHLVDKEVVKEEELAQTVPSASDAQTNPPNFWSLNDQERVMSIHRICEWQLDNPERFRNATKSIREDPQDLRVVPIGYDRFECSYWMFDDNRLYREWPSEERIRDLIQKKQERCKKRMAAGKRRSGASLETDLWLKETHPDNVIASKPTSGWELLCRTLPEWEAFPEKFKDAIVPDEKELYKMISKEILGYLRTDIPERESERRKVVAKQTRQRSSRIAIRELEQQQRELDEMRRKQQMGLVTADEIRDRFGDEYTVKDSKEDLAKAREQRYLERQWRLATGKRWDDGSASDSRRGRQSSARYSSYTDSYGGRSRNDQWVRRSERKRKRSIEYYDEDVSPMDPEEEEEWEFRCICGIEGKNIDGGNMIACDACGVWQHFLCVELLDPWVQRYPNWRDINYYCANCRPQYEKKAPRYANGDSLGVSEDESDDAPGSRKGRKHDSDGMDYESRDVSGSASDAGSASWSTGDDDEYGKRKRGKKSHSAGDTSLKLKLVLKSGASSTVTSARRNGMNDDSNPDEDWHP